MCTSDQGQSVVMAKCLNSVPTEQVAGSSSRYGPSFNHFWVRPKQIAHHSFLGYFSNPINFLKIVDFLDVGRQSSMHTEYFVVNYGGDGQVIKNFSEGTPYIERAILFNAFIVKTIHLSDQSRFVVASQQDDSVFVAHLQS